MNIGVIETLSNMHNQQIIVLTSLGMMQGTYIKHDDANNIDPYIILNDVTIITNTKKVKLSSLFVSLNQIIGVTSGDIINN